MWGVSFDPGGHQDVFALRSERIHQRERTAGDAWDDRNRVTRLQGRRFLLEITDVLFVHVDVHEISQPPVIRVEMPPKLVEPVDHVPEGLFDALRLDLYGVVIRGVLTKGRRDDDSDRRHGRVRFMTVLYLRFAPPVFASE